MRDWLENVEQSTWWSAVWLGLALGLMVFAGDAIADNQPLGGMLRDADVANVWLENSSLAGFSVLAAHLFAANAYAAKGMVKDRADVLDKAGAVVSELAAHEKMPIWDDHYVGRYWYEMKQDRRALSRMARAAEDGHTDGPMAYFLSLSYEFDKAGGDPHGVQQVKRDRYSAPRNGVFT